MLMLEDPHFLEVPWAGLACLWGGDRAREPQEGHRPYRSELGHIQDSQEGCEVQ